MKINVTKRVFVTGGADGIGLGIVEAMVRRMPAARAYSDSFVRVEGRWLFSARIYTVYGG